jgi:pilus assembly protein CpaC
MTGNPTIAHMKYKLLSAACACMFAQAVNATPFGYSDLIMALADSAAGGRANPTSAVLLAQGTANVERSGSPGVIVQKSDIKPETAATGIALYPGEVKVLPIAKVDRIAIGNGSVMTATIVDDKQIVLLGEAVGKTTMHLWLKNGRQQRFEVEVSGTNVAELAASELRRMLSHESAIVVTVVNDKIKLSGEYSSMEEAAKVKQLLQRYPQAVNLIHDRPAAVIVPREKMILMEVKVIEARKSALDNLGISWSTQAAGPTVANSALFYSNSRARPELPGDFGPATLARPFLSFVGMANQITSMINFLEQNGDSWTLAEPRVSTVNGGKSKVRVGGEVPIPVSTGLGQISVTYKEYGVILEIEPMVDANGSIRSKITTEVSKPDGSTGSGDFIGFITNRTETDVSLTEGESLVISGLLLNNGSRADQNVPGLHKIPLFGGLFSNRNFTNERTEMLVIVTPKLYVPGSAVAKAQEDRALSEVIRIEKSIRQGADRQAE